MTCELLMSKISHGGRHFKFVIASGQIADMLLWYNETCELLKVCSLYRAFVSIHFNFNRAELILFVKSETF